MNVEFIRILYAIQSRKTTVIHSYLKNPVFISYLFFLSSFLSLFFTSSSIYFTLSILKATVLLYSLLTQAVHNQASNWLKPVQAPHFHSKRFKEHQLLCACATEFG
jgi:hypothetical protein